MANEVNKQAKATDETSTNVDAIGDPIILRLGHGNTAFLNQSRIEGQEDQKYLKVSRFLGNGNDGQALYKNVNLSKDQIQQILANEDVVKWLDE